jgi:hypothetical protein
MKTKPNDRLRAFVITLGKRIAALMLLTSLLIYGSCTQTEIKESEGSEPCFTKESLETVSWIKDELAWFQRPKMSFLRVAVYRYRTKYYLAFENPTLSGTAGHIFNCAGQNLGVLGVGYNEFYDNVELMAVLLNEEY